MTPQYVSMRRGATTATMASWSRNRNTVRHEVKGLGSFSSAVIVVMLVMIMGLIYVAQGTQATNYDYELSAMEDEIAELEAKKEDLAVEKARLTSIASTEDSEVARGMEDASVEGYAR